ncbi:MAG: porin [Endomicrobiia bacterium]|nr:porin [Endomicrobiia bacterium]
MRPTKNRFKKFVRPRIVSKWFLFIATLMFLLGMPGSFLFSAGYEMRMGDETSAKFGFKMQNWLQSAQDASPDGAHPAANISVKTMRFYIAGRTNSPAQFSANVDWQKGAWDGSAVAKDAATVRDAQVMFDFAPEYKLMTGLFRTPFSRVALQDSFAYVLPHSPDIGGAGYVGDTTDFRNLGWAFTGELSSRKFKYYAGIFDANLNPIGAVADDAASFYSARISLTPAGVEKGYANSGAYLGGGDVFSMGAGYLSGKYKTGVLSPVYTAWTIDAFAERRLYGGTVTGEAAYFNYDRDIPVGKTSGWYILAAYLLPGSNIQPALRYEKSDREGAVVGGEDYRKMSGGVNWYLQGHDSKLQFEYALKDYDTEGTAPRVNRDYADITVAFQIQF